MAGLLEVPMDGSLGPEDVVGNGVSGEPAELQVGPQAGGEADGGRGSSTMGAGSCRVRLHLLVGLGPMSGKEPEVGRDGNPAR